MNDALRVNILDTLANLSHVNSDNFLGEDEIVVDNSFEQLAAFDSEKEKRERRKEDKHHMRLQPLHERNKNINMRCVNVWDVRVNKI